MKRMILAAGVAALAITVPAAADPGKNGNGKGRDRGAQVEKQRGGKKAVEQRRDNRRNFAEQRAERREKARERNVKARERVAERRGKAIEQARKAEQKRAERVREARADRLERIRDRRDDRRDRVREARADRIERIRDRRNDRIERIRDDRRYALRDRDWRDIDRRRVWADACPPGLAKKGNGCMPPGQAKKLVGERLNVVKQRVAFRDLPDRLRYAYRDTPDHYYRYGDGYVYRVNRSNDIVSSLLPLFGLGLTAGQQFPSGYSDYYMPSAYQPFYPASSPYDYRYANGYVYEVDPYTGQIVDVDPMLGYGYGYGQMLPATYSAYNVPYQYRPVYQDTSDYHYRYAPGAIYQVDPQTSLITGIAALLGNGMTIGQPMPAGYGVYNVPYDYRSQYYDTPDAWYRYSAGNIYRVDPTTQLVTAIVASILT